jgi:hypothetical protein
MKKQHCHVILLEALLFLNRYIVEKLDNRNGIYAQPLTGIFRANSNEPITAPQKEICSISVFMINSDMKIKEFVQEHMITHLLELCKQDLQIDELPPIVLVDDEPTVGGGTSFGEFDGESVRVVYRGRHPMDVMRTLAHELVHWKQMIEGEELDGSDGSDTENDANAVAGIIMRKFAKMYPQYFLDTIPVNQYSPYKLPHSLTYKH